MLSSLKLKIGMRTAAAILFTFLKMSTSMKRNDKWLSLEASEIGATYTKSKHGLHVWWLMVAKS